MPTILSHGSFIPSEILGRKFLRTVNYLHHNKAVNHVPKFLSYPSLYALHLKSSFLFYEGKTAFEGRIFLSQSMWEGGGEK